MHIKEELVVNIHEELNAIVHDHLAVTIAAADVPPMDFDWPIYCALQSNGMLKLYTARDDGELAGFVMYQVAPHLHHRGVLSASCDTFAVLPTHQGMGVGRALLKFAEPKLKEFGAQIITHHYRVSYKVKPLFPKLGHKLIEYIYVKELV